MSADDATFCNIQLYGADAVLVRYDESPFGRGVTAGGIYVEHSHNLPAVLGEVVAHGPGAVPSGIRKGMFILFTRYAGTVTDVLDDGTTFSAFDYHDLKGEYVERRSDRTH